MDFLQHECIDGGASLKQCMEAVHLLSNCNERHSQRLLLQIPLYMTASVKCLCFAEYLNLNMRSLGKFA